MGRPRCPTPTGGTAVAWGGDGDGAKPQATLMPSVSPRRYRGFAFRPRRGGSVLAFVVLLPERLAILSARRFVVRSDKGGI